MIETKICKKCNLDKELSEFRFRKNKRWGKDHFEYWCKECFKLYLKERRRKQKSDWMNKSNKCLPNKFKLYVRSAKRRNKDFDLTIDFFKELINKPCAYCGELPIEGGMLGVDRVVNEVGYIKSNCVSCCSKCNYLKRDSSKEDFINHCKKVMLYNP